MEQEVVTQEVAKTEEPAAVEYSPIQVKAIEQGWIPKEEFDGDESEFIDAPEFVRRGELFGKIEKQSKELKAVRQALEALSAHHSKVKEMEYERALKTLKDAKREATINGEHERALALEDKIDEVKAEKDQISREAANTQVREPEGYTPEFQNWVSRNEWYETNRLMRGAADVLGKQLYDEGHSPGEVLKMVEQEIRKEFAHKFSSPAAKRPMAVEVSTRSSGNKKDSFVLSSEQRDIMRKIVSVTPGYTEADYIKEIQALEGKQ